MVFVGGQCKKFAYCNFTYFSAGGPAVGAEPPAGCHTLPAASEFKVRARGRAAVYAAASQRLAAFLVRVCPCANPQSTSGDPPSQTESPDAEEAAGGACAVAEAHGLSIKSIPCESADHLFGFHVSSESRAAFSVPSQRRTPVGPLLVATRALSRGRRAACPCWPCRARAGCPATLGQSRVLGLAGTICFLANTLQSRVTGHSTTTGSLAGLSDPCSVPASGV